MRRLQVPALRLQILRPGLRLPREIGWRHWPGLAGPVCRGFLNLAAAQADRRGHRLDVFAHALGQPPAQPDHRLHIGAILAGGRGS